MTKQRMAMRSNFPWSDFKKLGTPELSSSSSTSTALSPKNFEKRAHPTENRDFGRFVTWYNVHCKHTLFFEFFGLLNEFFLRSLVLGVAKVRLPAH